MTMTAPNHEHQALAKRDADDMFKFGLEPAGLTEAMDLCKLISESGMFGGTQGGKLSPQSALVRLMTGRQLGIPAMAALQNVYDVYGRPALSARLKMALVLRHPECEKFEHVSSDNTKAVYVVKRRGQAEKTFEFKIEDAHRAGLVKKDSNWEKWPRRMCQARASSEAADVVFPEACMGLPVLEEAEDEGRRASDIVVEVTKPETVPARDWDAEAAKLKAALTEAAELGGAAVKSAREMFKRFQEEAPAEHAQAVLAFYNELAAKKRAATNGQTTAPAQTAAAPAESAHSAAAQRAAREARENAGRNPHPYLPPSQRGDSYEGPSEPPIPFGGEGK